MIVDEKQEAAVDLVMGAAQSILRDAYGADVGIVMLVKAQNNSMTAMATNLDAPIPQELMKGYIQHVEGGV